MQTKNHHPSGEGDESHLYLGRKMEKNEDKDLGRIYTKTTKMPYLQEHHGEG